MASDWTIDQLLDHTAAELQKRRALPEATYRLQFHKGFTFRDACRIVPYLNDLGITHIYASPYLKARPGSQHGYDISDHRVLNPEIGNNEDHAALVRALRDHGMNHIVDMVPNHMGIVGNENVWWNDVLENGPASAYANFFDIDWSSSLKEELHDRVLLPVLGENYGKVLESGHLQLHYEAGTFRIHYFDHHFPISPCSFDRILEHRLAELEEQLGADDLAFQEYLSILTAVKHLPPQSDRAANKVAERLREKEMIKRRLAALVESNEPIREFLAETLVRFNGKPGESHSFDALDELLNAQAYRLSYWRVASDEINYRRFFDVNELAALSMERPEVFKATHELILSFLGAGDVSGLRIDHPDGLYDPREYLLRLQRHYIAAIARHIAGPDADWSALEKPLHDELKVRTARGDDWLQRPLYLLVEKILESGEPLPEDWPVNGTTGYEFLNSVNGLFVDSRQNAVFDRLYQRFSRIKGHFHDFIYHKKFLILQVALSGELHMLAHQLNQLSEKHRFSRDFTFNSLRHALREVIACFPVYRSYIAAEAIGPRDRLYIQRAVGMAMRKNPAISASLFDFVRHMLLLRYPAEATQAVRDEVGRFVGKFQQVTSPVMAKGVEDTTFYVYNRLLSLNEVGGDPSLFGIPPSYFHRSNQERQQRWPRALSSTATHDTKRGEDTRARLNVLSEMPTEWSRAIRRWSTLNEALRVEIEELKAPDHNEEYLLYQTLVGTWPLNSSASRTTDDEAHATYVERIQNYMQKAIHEAKVHTSWINPDPAYDDAIRTYVARVLDARTNAPFVDDCAAFAARVAHFGLFNSLAQTLLKIVSPGVPDMYQGTELWEFSLVDPDNRRPVDYEERARLLKALKQGSEGGQLAAFARSLIEGKEDGRAKLYVVRTALRCRRANPGLFAEGEYLPAEVSGAKQEHICALTRRLNGSVAIAAVPRLVLGLLGGRSELPLGAPVWEDTEVLLQGVRAGARLRNLFTGEVLTAETSRERVALRAADLFRNFPVALLMVQE
jgi:(1->4)-alpha-D-glucan 1-alpha-D-glucosylmutase